MFYVYILHPTIFDKFYIGFTSESPLMRLDRHNSDYYADKYTSLYKPWSLFWTLECKSNNQAIQIEAHIKNMKSKVYIQNLLKYPEISTKLLSKYSM